MGIVDRGWFKLFILYVKVKIAALILMLLQENYMDPVSSFAELPDTSFTRSISNPEAVMRRRRQQKLERKLQQFRSKDGGPGAY